jgi:hypothetical protein
MVNDEQFGSYTSEPRPPAVFRDVTVRMSSTCTTMTQPAQAAWIAARPMGWTVGLREQVFQLVERSLRTLSLDPPIKFVDSAAGRG